MGDRLATLAVALIAAGSVCAQVARAQEESPVTIDAERIEGVSELEMSARGSAELKRDDVTVFGETLRYNREFERVEADGGVRMQSGLDRFFGERLEYNAREATGVFEAPGYILERELTARGRAERLEFLGPNRFRLKGASYTTCAPGREDWKLEAEEIVLDFDSSEGRATSPRLRFFDTTILAAPFAFFPLDNQRRSGVLSPYYAQSTSRGFEVGLPYYWNIAPERDATITPVYMSRRGAQLKTLVRYLERPYNGQLRVEYLPEDRLFNADRYGVSLQHSHSFFPELSGQVDYNRVSDDRYFVDLATQVRQVSVSNLPQDAYLTYGGSVGRVGLGLQARVQKFQTLQDPQAPITPPYHRVPQLNLGSYVNDLGGVLDAALPVEFVQFSHPTLVEGARLALQPTLAAPRLAPGWFIIPKAGARYVGYDLTRAASGVPTRPDLTIPWASIDGGLVFERQARWFGETLTQTLEPRAFYVYVPYRAQEHIPLFDTALADFNYAQLFSENRFSGGDRFGDANHVTLALTTRYVTSDGSEAFRATVGQRYHFQSERVALTPGGPVRNFQNSDVLASVGGRVFKHWLFDATTQYSPTDNEAQRFTASVRYAPEVAKVLNASYRFNRGTVRQFDLSGQWPVAAGWYAVGRYNYSLLDKRLLEGLFGLEYNAGCWVMRAVVQRIQAATQVSSTAFFFQIEFNGVGQLGTDEAVSLLQRNVPGYSVTNPRDLSVTPPSMRPRLPFEQVF